jgi:glucosamine-6-phosphate deaminase
MISFSFQREFCFKDHPESYHSFMWNHFFKYIDIDPKNVHILDGNATDLIHECNEYERAIQEAGGIELFIGGIGPDGHIAFNEPGRKHFFYTK